MIGAEYLNVAVLADLWTATDTAFDVELGQAGLNVQEFLKRRNPAWNLVGRVNFNLAENRKDEHAPFAFLATYTTRLSAQAKAQHLPLGKALQEYSGAKNRDRLLSLLVPVQRAAERCSWLKAMVDAGEIYHPLRWTPAEAVRFLKDVPALESSGVIVRMPATWRMNRPAHPQVKATVGGKAPSQLGMDALLDFRMEVTLDGETLTKAEIKSLLKQSEGLAFIRGQWVEVDHDRLNHTLEQFEAIEQHAATEGLSFGEAMRLLAGAGLTGDGAAGPASIDWGQTVAGPWLSETLAALRLPDGAARVDPGQDLQATLRPYQKAGVQWLHLLSQLRLGACLADDMGLGKTIQVLSLLLILKREDGLKRKCRHGGQPSLLVAPASLLANWAAEIEKFAPSLTAMIAHPSAMPADELKSKAPDTLMNTDLVITSYGSLARVPWINQTAWRLVIIDEAQAIKNPGAKQTKAVKALKADGRIALTGTPIENRLGDLWSIFDFINPGLMGSSKQFSDFSKRLADRPQNPYAPLRDLVRPYILRRLKTDKSIIADLPDKTEVKTYCPLTRKQAALYQEAVEDLTKQLEQVDGMKRRGLVLAFLMRFKQICNHPSQWLGDGEWDEANSGKLGRLRDIGEVILPTSRRRSSCSPSSGRPRRRWRRTSARCSVAPGSCCMARRRSASGKIWCGNSRRTMTSPFFVLSVKAGGAGLNLTAASHVIHLDRWWNPAVENQATDRAFRIGQTRNVLVHEFVCRGDGRGPNRPDDRAEEATGATFSKAGRR